jgi:acyl-coenzyme A thioesterase PaaI-like protein
MLAINHPNVVLGSAEVRLTAPVRVGDRLQATARRVRIEGKKHIVEVEVLRGEQRVFQGSFVCFVPAAHVLAPGVQAEP